MKNNDRNWLSIYFFVLILSQVPPNLSARSSNWPFSNFFFHTLNQGDITQLYLTFSFTSKGSLTWLSTLKYALHTPWLLNYHNNYISHIFFPPTHNFFHRHTCNLLTLSLLSLNFPYIYNIYYAHPSFHLLDDTHLTRLRPIWDNIIIITPFLSTLSL